MGEKITTMERALKTLSTCFLISGIVSRLSTTKRDLKMDAKLVSSFVAKSMLFSLLVSGSVFAGEFSDDFSSGTLAKENWSDPAYERDVHSGKYWSGYSRSSIDNGLSRNRLSTDDLGNQLDSVEATVTINDFQSATNSTAIFARIEGQFYTATTPSGPGVTGLVWAAINIGEKTPGSGLKAWWQWEKSLDANFNDSDGETGEFALPSTFQIEKDKEYFIQIVYTAANNLTFTIGNSEWPGNVDVLKMGPTYGSVASSTRARLTTGANFDASGDGSVASIQANFDDATVNWDSGSSFSDDFSQVAVNSNNWLEDNSQAMVETPNGPMVVTVQAEGNKKRYTAALYPTDTTQNCLYAEAAWDSVTTGIPLEHRGRVRVAGWWYNDTYPGPTYNGIEGNVFAHVVIENPGGPLRAKATIWREDPDHDDDGTSVAWHEFSTVPEPDKSYPMYVELDKANKKLTLSFNGEKFVHDIATEIYDTPPDDQYKAFQVRVQDDDDDDPKDAAEGFLSASVFQVTSAASCPQSDFFVIPLPDGGAAIFNL